MTRPWKVKVAFSAYLLISFLMTFVYVFTFGYSFWGTDKATVWLDVLTEFILLGIVALQFKPKTRVLSWLLLPPTYLLVLYSLSNMARFNINVIYFGLIVSALMMSLAISLNWFLKKNSKSTLKALRLKGIYNMDAIIGSNL